MKDSLYTNENWLRSVEKLKKYNEETGKKRREKYSENPKLCKFCNKLLEYKNKRNDFCNQSCAAKFNNRCKKIYNVITEPKNSCLFCGKKTKNKKFCNNKCSSSYRWEIHRKEIEEGKEHDSRPIKKYLVEKKGNKCEICGHTEWLGKFIPLVLDHIDGNSYNNNLNNLRLVCGNCDMQLPTYKGKNVGHGRHYRRQRYRDGKSY